MHSSSSLRPQSEAVSSVAQLLGVPVATATFTLSAAAPTMLVLPPSFGMVELVWLSASGGVAAYPNVPSGMVSGVEHPLHGAP